MKEYVLDVNILFSAIISGKEFYREILTKNRFYLPDFALDELRKYENILILRTKLTLPKLKEYTLLLFDKLIITPQFIISTGNILKAYGICRDTDVQDTLYVALSLEMNAPFITRDKELYDGLKVNGFDSVILFNDFLKDWL